MTPSYRILDHATWWLYLPLTLAVTTALGYGIAVDTWTERRVVTAYVLAAWWLGMALRYLARWRSKRAINYTLAPWGIDVRGADGKGARHWLEGLVRDEIAFWVSRATSGAAVSRVATAMLGGSITFVDKPFRMREQPGEYAGAANGNNVTVVWMKGEDFDEVAPRLKHELGHVLLTATRGYEDEALDHMVLAEVGRL